MKLNRTEPKCLFTLILALHITSIHVEASHNNDDDVRILIVGIRGDSRFSAADLLSGRKDGGQKDREIVKTPVITDEGRRMMLVTGPNLCEEDTARQSFTTALFLSSPGPHAVLMVLNLENQESEQCDIVKRAQELLGAEVLQYCIVLLHQHHQERFTGASRGIAGEMINACGGRFHMIRDSEPKPDQTAALVAEIDKLIWLNGDRFYSVSTQELKTEETSQDVHEENQLLSVLGGAAGIVGWIVLVSLHLLVVYTKGNEEILKFGAKFVALVLFMVYLKRFLSPEVAIPLHLALITSLTTVLKKDPTVIGEFKFSRRSNSLNVKDIIVDFIANYLILPILGLTVITSLPFILGSSLVLGSIISIRSWSDVLIACHAAPGVTIGAFAFIFHYETISRKSPVLALGSFLCCIVGATLSMGVVTVFAELGLKMTIMLIILGLPMAYRYLKRETLGKVIGLPCILLFYSCGCVLIGSVFLIFDELMLSFLKVLIESLVSSYSFYVALLLIVIWRRQTASVRATNSD